MANSWGESGTTWGQGDWGNQNNYTLTLTGLSMTGSLGEPAAASEQGWGRSEWGNEPWGDSYSPVISVSGFAITASLGTLAYAAAIEGWGRDEWGYGNWGENTTTVIVDGLEMTTGLGDEGWGRSTWGNNAWGQRNVVDIEIAEPLTGFSITGSLGTPTINHDFIFTLSDSLLLTASRGVLSINNGADHTQGVGGLAATMSLGTVTEIVTALPSGYEATMSLGTLTITSTELINLTGFTLTASQGSIGTIPDMARGVSGYSITGSVGSLTITDMQVGLTGIEITGNLGSGGVSPLHYKDVDITGNTSYTYVEHSA